MPLPGSGSAAEADKVKQHDWLLPPLPVQGPQQEQQPRRDFDGTDWSLHDDCCIAFLDAETIEEAVSGVRARIQQKPISWTMCRTTLLQLAATVNEHAGEDALGHLDGHRLSARIGGLAEPGSWPFLQEDRVQPQEEGSLGYLEAELLRCQVPSPGRLADSEKLWPTQSCAPRLFR